VQTLQWSEMVERHRKEEWGTMKGHLAEQQDILKRLMELAQASQMKQVETKHEREIKELNTRQAKVSVETMKEVANDKALKTKGEKDRRLKEKQQNNTKKFMDERKYAKMKQEKEKDKLKIKHEKEMEELIRDVNNLIEMYKNEEIEYELAPKTEFFALELSISSSCQPVDPPPRAIYKQFLTMVYF
ncbi:unnamed protein product, partial [Timema podura]|nr:unnamed protein product [Timema podura]